MDSENILSILAALGQPPSPMDAVPPPDPGITPTTFQPLPISDAPIANVLQAAAAPLVVDVPAPPVTLSSPPPAPKPAVSDEHPRKRQSAIDVIGRLADVFATVGGAQALYQPTLDNREDRTLGLEDRQRKIAADEIELATDKFALGGVQNERLAQAARGVKAIMASNPDANPAQIWGLIAERMRIPPEEAQAIGQQLTENPALLDGLISASTDPKLMQSKFGGSVIYAKDPEGKIVAFQPGLGDDGARNILPEGYEAIDPLKFVDTGGTQVGVGSRSGRVSRILPKQEAPGKAQDRASRERIAASGNRSRERVASMKGDKAGPDPAMVEAAQGNLNELRGIFNDLNKMGAMVSPSKSTGANVGARIRSSLVGQTLEGAIGTEAQTKRDRVASIRPQLMQALAKATGMTGRQLDSNADVKLFMQTVTDPTRSYEANIKAIEGLERFLRSNSKKTAAPEKSTASGWSVVKVQ